MDKTGNDSRSHQDSGFTEGNNDLSEEAIIQQHIANELASGSFNERSVENRVPKPDLVSPERGSPDVYGMDNTGYIDEPPEHYDIENASSIAPSDLVDVVSHYKKYRSGLLGHGKPAGNHRHPHRHSPSNFLAANQPISESPIRRSPAHMLEGPHGRSPLTISPLTINNVNKLNRAQSPLARNSPLNQLSRTTPTAHLHASSPVPQSSLRSTPINGLYGPASNHSNSSASYKDHNNIPVSPVNGHPGSRMTPLNHLGMRSTPTRGLSIEEVDRLNQRGMPTPPSTLDAISSSTEAPRNNLNRPALPGRRPPLAPPQHTYGVGDPSSLDPADSSSDSGASNDSFTCSEFEYENENKIRNDVNSRMKFPQLPETENEHEDTDVSRTLTKSPTDSNRDSLSAFFTSEDELPKPTNKILNGALNLDYLLNWGPNYEKLVGVFNDIAELPDMGPPVQRPGSAMKRTVSPHGSRTMSPTGRPSSRPGSSTPTRSYGRTISPLGGRTTSPGGHRSPRHHHNKTPPNFKPGQMRSASATPSGRPSSVTPRERPASVTPGQRPSSVTPGQRPASVTPGQRPSVPPRPPSVPPNRPPSVPPNRPPSVPPTMRPPSVLQGQYPPSSPMPNTDSHNIVVLDGNQSSYSQEAPPSYESLQDSKEEYV